MKNKSLLTLLFAFLFIIVGKNGLATQEDISAFFYRGNILYEQAKYDEAITEYSRIIEKGYESGNIYYNLGNCYFKKGQLGKAILNYERAMRLIPNDKDLESNYDYALSFVKGNIIGLNKPLPFRILHRIFTPFTINGMTILLSFMYLAALFLIIAGQYNTAVKKKNLFILAIIALLFVVGFLSLNSKILILGKEGVIITKEAKARYEPFERATTHYVLYEGMKVEIIQSEKMWCKIKRPDGKTGWIKKNAIERI